MIYRYGNCLSERGYDYGLRVFVGSSSKIQIVSPSTKESISKGNKGGGNWGAWGGATLNQIVVIKGNVKKTENEQNNVR